MEGGSGRAMTPDDLERAVLDGDTTRVVALLTGATEAERLACGARMVRLRKEHGDWTSLATDRARNEATLLALLGTGTAAQIAAGRRMGRHEAARTVLRLRPEALLVELVPWMLERLGWQFVRALVRDGTIPRPSGDAYIVGMLDGFIDAPELLRDDPDLLDHEVWRAFEVEGTGDHSLADHDKYTPDAKSWSRALLDLAGSRLDRSRLLDASLAALERDFPAFRAGWYSRFHEAMAPTPAERAARVDTYLRLLRSPVAPTVTFAVAALAIVEKSGRLDGDLLLAHVEPAVGVRAAGTAKAALRLIELAVRADPTLAGAAVRPASAALVHGSADVQGRAIVLFETVLGPVDPETAALLAERGDDVAASIRPRLDALVGGARPEAPGPTIEATEPPAVEVEIEPADAFGSMRRLEPVGSVEDLVELLAGILEREGPPEDLERALDGVLRFSGERPADFSRLTKSIRVRAERLLKGRRDSGIAMWFAALVLSWVDGTVPEEPRPMAGALAQYLAARVRAVAREAAAGRARQLIALPTYAGGWIEPVDLVARLVATQRGLGLTGPEVVSDVALALLRVLPVRRAEALRSAGELVGEVGDAVRHGLGGVATVGPTRALWAAAARCRTPDGDDPDVARVHPDLGPDGAVAGRYTLTIRSGRYLQRVQVDSGVPGDPSLDLPAGLLWRTSAHTVDRAGEGPIIDWLRLIWPQDRRSWFAVSAALLLDNLDWWEARWHDRRRLEALFEPWTPLGREAAMLLVVTLQAKEPGQRGLAVDAAVDAVARLRLPAARLVQGFHDVASGLNPQAPEHPITFMRPSRLAASLDEVARRSEAHARWTLEVAAGSVAFMRAATSPEPVAVGQLTPLLRLLVELTAALRVPVPEVAESALRQLSGGAGEGARLARTLHAGMQSSAAR